MKTNIPKIAAIHDIVGIGKVGLCVALPIISAMGVLCCPIVTAVLSSHLAGYGKTSYADLTDTFEDSFAHYKRLDYKFDLIYTGFFATVKQINAGIEFIEHYKGIPVIVDPVMADDGKPYDTYTEDRIKAMRKISRVATIITPNFTEAYLLLDKKNKDFLTVEETKEILSNLHEMGPKTVIITSVPIKKNDEIIYYNVAYSSEDEKYYIIKPKIVYGDDKLPQSYPGTGDIFVSVLSASLLQNMCLPQAMEKATRFLDIVILQTNEEADLDIKEGILFENKLSWLLQENAFEGCDVF